VLVSSVGPFLAGAFFAFVLFAGMVAVAAYAGWRVLRRRWRRAALHPAVRTASALWTAVAATSLGHWLSSGEAGQVAAHRGSWKMWRAVGDAERAVSAATDAGAPVGDLPALVRRLHIVADEVEGIQRLAPARAGHDVAESQRQKMSDVVTAAHDIHRAAVAATGDMSDPSSVPWWPTPTTRSRRSPPAWRVPARAAPAPTEPLRTFSIEQDAPGG